MDSLPPDSDPPPPPDEAPSSGGLPTWAEGTGPVALSGRWDSMAALEGLTEAPGAAPRGEDRYTRGSVLGQGGMGTVYLAEDQRLRRQVAIKEARGGAGEARLLAEARIIAALDHPGIVPVYDTGVDADGRPWYAMRVVRGRTLARAIADAADLDGRLRLLRPFLGACEAVAYAHDRGLVHRDLKPDNIILGAYGEAQVMDWGLARPVDAGSAAWAAVLDATRASTGGVVIGTPAYMSPEQAGGDPVGPRADVWSLGVCLYELVTGTRPFSGDSPMDVVARVRTGAVPDPRALVPDAPAELCTIIAKATARDADARYADGAALARDLGAFLDGRRVTAHRYTALAELRRALVRWRRTLVAVAVVGAVAVAFLSQAWWVALGERDRAVQAQEELRAEQALSQEHLAAALVAQAQAAAAAGARGEAETLAAHSLLLEETPEARGLLMEAGPRPRRVQVLPSPDCTERSLTLDGAWLACRKDGRVAVHDTATMAARWERDLDATEVAVASDDLLLVAREGERFRVAFDLVTGVPREGLGRLARGDHVVVPGRAPGRVLMLSGSGFIAYGPGARRTSPAGHQLLAATGLPGGDVLAATDTHLLDLGRDDADVRSVALPPSLRGPVDAAMTVISSPDQRTLLVGTVQGRVVRLDRRTAGILGDVSLSDDAVPQVAWSPDGRHVAALDSAGRAWVWTVGEPAGRVGLPGRVDALRFDTDGQLVLLGEELSRWRLPSAGAAGVRSAGAGVSNLDWRGDTLAAAVGDGRVRMWRGEEVRDVRIVTAQVTKDVALGPPAADGWPAVAAASMVTAPGLPEVDDVILPVAGADHVHAPGCRRVLWLGEDGLFCNPILAGPWAYGTDGAVRSLVGDRVDLLVDAEADADRRRGAFVAYSGEVLLVDLAEPGRIRQVLHDEGGRAVALGGADALVLGREDEVQLWSLDGGVRWTAETTGRPRDVAISEAAGLVAAGQLDGRTRLWRAADGALVAVLSGHAERAQAVAFAPDGSQLATGSWDASVRLWDLAVLDRPAEALLAEVEAAWGLSLEEALASASGG